MEGNRLIVPLCEKTYKKTWVDLDKMQDAIPFLILFVFFGVPFFLGGLAQSWRIHDPALTIGQHTRPPTHVTFGKEWESTEPGHDGPAAVGQSDRGVDGNSRGSEHALGPNA